MAGSRKRRALERTRFIWGLGLAALIPLSFLLGPVIGLLLGLPLLGPLYSLGLELARPLLRNPIAERTLARVLHATLWSYVFLLGALVAWVTFLSPGGEVSLGGSTLVKALFAVFVPSGLAILVAVWFILRARGSRAERRFYKGVWIAFVPIGAIYLVGMGMDASTDEALGPGTFSSLGMLLALCDLGLVALAALFAWIRMWSPKWTTAASPAPVHLADAFHAKPEESPTFDSHRG